MKNPKWKLLESAMGTVSRFQYEKGMKDMVGWLARNGFIRKKQATFLLDYIEDPGIQVLDGENNLWFAQTVNGAAKALGIPEELPDDYFNHD